MFKAIFSNGMCVEYSIGLTYNYVSKKFKYFANFFECQGVLYFNDTPIIFTGNEFLVNTENEVFNLDFVSMEYERSKRFLSRNK